VTLAVLCTSTGSALDPADAARLAGDLSDALTAAGASRVERLPSGMGQLPQIARIARSAREPLLLCADNLVAHPSLLWMLATEPAGRTTALVISDDHGDLREDRGRVLRGAHGVPVRFAGAMFVARADLPLLAATADRLSGSVRTPDGMLATDIRSALDLVLSALVEADRPPAATRARVLHAERVITPAQLAAARAAVAAVDEEAARLRLAVKEKDDFFTTYAVSTWSPRVTRWCARRRLTPTAVTGLSVLCVVAAALCFWQASRLAMIAGAVLLYLGFVLDCVDGQLARFTRRFDPYGGWLDTMADRAKEYAVYAGLAAGADRLGLPYAWPLAITAIIVQTVRHMIDAWYGALHDEAVTHPRPSTGSRLGARLGAASNRVQGDTGSVAYWLKRIVVFPIGERWAVIALVAVFFDGRVVLAMVVLCGVLAFAYTVVLRSLRSIAMGVGVLDKTDTTHHRDDGRLVRDHLSAANGPLPTAGALIAVAAALTLAIALLTGWLPHTRWADTALPLVAVTLLVLVAGVSARARHAGALDWLVPALLRAAEFLMVVAVGLIGSVPPPLVYLLLFLLAMRHYDRIARMEKGTPPGPVHAEWLGWDGRVLVLTLTALLTVPAAGVVLLATAVGADLIHGVMSERWPRRRQAETAAT
jgi:phosphatidylglycerophosphate synthase